MQFTPQQLAGGPKFSPVTRIGNWQEELSLEEAKIANFESRSATGSLSLRKMQLKLSVCNELVPLTYTEDGILRFGDNVILKHESTSSVLVCDPFEEMFQGQSKYPVAAVHEEPQNKARNTYRIVRPPQSLCKFDEDNTDPILHIGQSFLLACNESLLLRPGSKLLNPTLYLASTKKNERMATRRTNRQLVYLTQEISAETIWLAIIPSRGRKNSSERFLSIGHPLHTNESFQITHRQTNMYLTCDSKTTTSTEFGIEYEVYADRSAAPGKLGLMISEFQGFTTSQTLFKPDAPIFSWLFLTSSDKSIAIDNRQLPPSPTNEIILSEVKKNIKSRGIDAYWNLREFLKKITSKLQNNFKLDHEDMKSCLLDWGLNVPSHYLDSLIDQVDYDKIGLIDINDFLILVRGNLISKRDELLSFIFNKLDINSTGYISINDIEKKFISTNHPLVSIGGYTEEETLKHFLKYFEINNKLPSKISYLKFYSYYADLSATIDDDNYFISIVTSNWKI